jgi:hypothetical protein
MKTAQRIVLWMSRLLGVAVALWIGMFALDAVGEGMPAILIHLSPALVLLLTVVLSWRRPWIGAAVFIALGVAYAAVAWARPDWVAIVSGPLLLVGALFLWSGRRSQ